MKIKNPKKYFLVLLFFSLVFSFAFFLFPKNSNAALNISPLKNLTSGLVGYWTMDGKDTVWTSSTAATTLDKSGNNNTGTLTSMTQSIATAAGKIGQGLRFDGTNDCVDAGLPASLDITGAVTVSAWIKPNSSAFGKSIAAKSTVSGAQSTQQYHLYDVGTNRMGFAVGNTTAILLSQTASNAVPNGKWSHLVGMYNGTDTTRFYLNGTQVDSDTSANFGALQQSGKNFNIGSTHGSTVCNAGYFNGSLDDVRVYNRALSAAEVTALYNLGSNSHLNVSPLKNLTSGLVGYWTMDGKDTVWTSSTAATTLDKSGNNNTGTLTSMTQSIATAAGKIGQGLKFANNDNAYVVTASDLIGVGGITFSAWVKMNSFGGGGVGRIISNGKFALRVQNIGGGRLYFSSDNETSSAVSASGSFLPNKWNFVTVTRTSATTANANIYINGILSGTANQNSGTPASTVNPDYIGRAVATGNAFDGLIDDARIYSRILSTTEIKQLYNMGR